MITTSWSWQACSLETSQMRFRIILPVFSSLMLLRPRCVDFTLAVLLPPSFVVSIHEILVEFMHYWLLSSNQVERPNSLTKIVRFNPTLSHHPFLQPACRFAEFIFRWFFPHLSTQSKCCSVPFTLLYWMRLVANTTSSRISSSLVQAQGRHPQTGVQIRVERKVVQHCTICFISFSAEQCHGFRNIRKPSWSHPRCMTHSVC